MLSWKNRRDRHSHGLNALEQLALQGDYNATLSHNLTEAKLIVYETQPNRILKSNAFRSALHSTRRLISNLPHLQQRAEQHWQQQQLLNLQRILSEARAHALAAAERNEDAREVLMLLSKFLGVSALSEVGGALNGEHSRRSSSASTGRSQIMGAAMQRGWQAVQTASSAGVQNVRTILDRYRDTSPSATNEHGAPDKDSVNGAQSLPIAHISTNQIEHPLPLAQSAVEGRTSLPSTQAPLSSSTRRMPSESASSSTATHSAHSSQLSLIASDDVSLREARLARRRSDAAERRRRVAALRATRRLSTNVDEPSKLR